MKFNAEIQSDVSTASDMLVFHWSSHLRTLSESTLSTRHIYIMVYSTGGSAPANERLRFPLVLAMKNETRINKYTKVQVLHIR